MAFHLYFGGWSLDDLIDRYDGYATSAEDFKAQIIGSVASADATEDWSQHDEDTAAWRATADALERLRAMFRTLRNTMHGLQYAIQYVPANDPLRVKCEANIAAARAALAAGEA